MPTTQFVDGNSFRPTTTTNGWCVDDDRPMWKETHLLMTKIALIMGRKIYLKLHFSIRLGSKQQQPACAKLTGSRWNSLKFTKRLQNPFQRRKLILTSPRGGGQGGRQCDQMLESTVTHFVQRAGSGCGSVGGRFRHQRFAVRIQSSANFIHYQLHWKDENREK